MVAQSPSAFLSAPWAHPKWRPSHPCLLRPPAFTMLPFLLAAMFSRPSLACQFRIVYRIHSRTVDMAAAPLRFSIVLIFSGIGCSGGGGATQLDKSFPPQSARNPGRFSPRVGTFTSATIYLHRSRHRRSHHPLHDGWLRAVGLLFAALTRLPFPLSSAATVQAMATAPGYSDKLGRQRGLPIPDSRRHLSHHRHCHRHSRGFQPGHCS